MVLKCSHDLNVKRCTELPTIIIIARGMQACSVISASDTQLTVNLTPKRITITSVMNHSSRSIAPSRNCASSKRIAAAPTNCHKGNDDRRNDQRKISKNDKILPISYTLSRKEDCFLVFLRGDCYQIHN